MVHLLRSGHIARGCLREKRLTMDEFFLNIFIFFQNVSNCPARTYRIFDETTQEFFDFDMLCRQGRQALWIKVLGRVGQLQDVVA